jgi:hypothetical protein
MAFRVLLLTLFIAVHSQTDEFDDEPETGGDFIPSNDDDENIFTSEEGDCSIDNLAYDFSECDRHYKRTAYFYWKKPCTSGEPLPAPIHNLDCTLECGPGQKLDMDLAHFNSTCSLCPDNTFNIGGGDLYSGAANYWVNLERDFELLCYVSSYST